MLDLRDVIVHVLRLAGPGGVNRTMLVKLVYFAELEHWRRFARPLTDTPFRLYRYGAWAPEVVYVAEKSDFIEHSYFQGFHWQHNYRLKADPGAQPLPSDLDDLLREVVARYIRKTAAEVGLLSKQTEPMIDAKADQRLDLSVAAPRKPRFRVRSGRLRNAQRSLDLSRRGTREEIDARDMAELEAWAPARRRAARI